MQHLLPWLSDWFQESKQHMVRSLAAVGIRYPIQAGASCFCAVASIVCFNPAAAESSCSLALVTLGFCAALSEASISVKMKTLVFCMDPPHFVWRHRQSA